MKHIPMQALSKEVVVPVYAFASPVYWSNSVALDDAFELLEESLRTVWSEIPPASLDFALVATDQDADAVAHRATGSLAVFVSMSGAVQGMMKRVAEQFENIAIVHAYLPGELPSELTNKLMHLNAHPPCADFYAYRRMQSLSTWWIDPVSDLVPLWRAFRAVERLSVARLLMIGETEPWVMNSCRSPTAARDRFGVDIVPVSLAKLYNTYEQVQDSDLDSRVSDWIGGASEMVGVVNRDVSDACKVVIAMERLLDQYGADGLAVACFAMIEQLDTTSCLALSMLNQGAQTIGACEGDLDAALTMFLLKALGADFVWIANPVFHKEPYVDLAHCTSPTCGCGEQLAYKLTRHHESGKGVSPEVTLPSGEDVTLARIGNNLEDIAVHRGVSDKQPKMPTCNTQLRVHLSSSQRVIDTLLGTHMVLSFGDYSTELSHIARLTGLRYL